MQMDLASHKILLASIVEARECFYDLMGARQTNRADIIHQEILKRIERYDAGIYAEPGDSGVAEDSEGSGEG